MSVQIQPQVRAGVEWLVALDVEAEWQHADACVAGGCVAGDAVASRRPVEPPVEEDEWWPGGCIP